MKKILLSAANPDEQRIVVLKDEIIAGYVSYIPGMEDRRNNIYRGVVAEIGPSLNACFVEIGDSKKGFLQFNEIDKRYLKPGTDENISSRLEKGQPLLVQILKDSRSDKGPLLSTRIKLLSNRTIVEPLPRDDGRFSISREAEIEERHKLTENLEQFAVPKGMSLLVRTSGLSASPAQLAWEVRSYLLSLWEKIEQMYKSMDAPGLIYHDQNIANLCVREHFDQEVDQLICDSEMTTQEVRSLIEALMPEMSERVQTVAPGTTLFDEHVLSQLDALLSREVRLPSGGELVIDITEALVAIDVNSGRARSEGNIEDTAIKTNLEAVDEIVRQLRLRNLSGIIVVDFIDMEQQANRRKVHSKMYRALRDDRAQIHTCNSLSQFGLFELTRQNIGRALYEAHSSRCPKCGGTGRIMLIKSFALSILDKLRDLVLTRKNTGMVTIELPTGPATYLLNEHRGSIREIESSFGIDIVIIPSNSMEIPDSLMRIDKVSKLQSGNNQHSYQMQLSNIPDKNSYADVQKTKRRNATAAITSFQPKKQMPEQVPEKNLFDRIKSFFQNSRRVVQKSADTSANKSTTPRGQRAAQQRNSRRSKQQPDASKILQTEKKETQNRRRRSRAGTARKRAPVARQDTSVSDKTAPPDSETFGSSTQHQGKSAASRRPATRASEVHNINNSEQPAIQIDKSSLDQGKLSHDKEKLAGSGTGDSNNSANNMGQNAEKTLKKTTRKSTPR